ncbi:MAG TPA: hypothetical protein VMT89_02855 [Candidatus Acidoferrales bacterium]|nr:hypothetical protein [Candidatus Acidoferrales bacterium]
MMDKAANRKGNGFDSVAEALTGGLLDTDSLASIEQQARTLVRERPFVAVLAAVAAGYAIARLVRRI